MSRHVLLLLGVLVAAAVASLLWRQSGGRPAVPPQRADVVAVVEPGPTAPSPPARQPTVLPEGLEVSTETTLEPISSTPEQDGALVTLHGNVTVTDPEGVRHGTEDGQLVLKVLHADWETSEQVQVVGGLWSCRVPADLRLVVGGLRLAGRVAYPTLSPRQTIAVPADRFLALEATWPAATVLVVEDAETGQPLEGIELVSGLGAVTAMHPGRADLLRPIASGLASPVAVTPSHPAIPLETFFVRSPGYAWAEVEVDFRLGGERLVELRPSGRLRVSLSRPPAPGEMLALWRGDDSAAELELPLEGESEVVELDSLLPGERRVAVQLGHWFGEALRLGEGVVTVVPGTTSDVALLLERGPQVVTATLSGTLTVPEGWRPGPRRLFLTFEDTPLGGEAAYVPVEAQDMVPVDGRPDTYAWSLPGLQTGPWKIQVLDPALEFDVEVLPGGSEVELVLPARARVRLRVVDQDGAPAEVDGIYWNPPREEGGVTNVVEAGEEPGIFEFDATEGTVQISVRSDEFRSLRSEFELGPGSNELELAVQRDCGVYLVFKDGDTIVPWDTDWDVHVEWTRDRRRTRSGRGWTSAGGFKLTSDRPGSCRVWVDNIPGYRAVPPLSVEVRSGPHRTLEVPLERLR